MVKTSKSICIYLEKLLSKHHTNEIPDDFSLYKKDIVKFSRLINKKLLPALAPETDKSALRLKLPIKEDQPGFLFQAALTAQKLCLYLITLNIEKSAQMAQFALKEEDFVKTEREMAEKLGLLERCVSGYWHPAAEEAFTEFRVEKNVKIGGVQWFLVAVKTGDRELKDLKIIDLKIPEEMHFLLQRDEADHSNLKLEFVERRFKSKIAEIITEREELLLRVKSVEQKLADAQDLIEKSGLEKVEGPLMNGGESDL